MSDKLLMRLRRQRLDGRSDEDVMAEAADELERRGGLVDEYAAKYGATLNDWMRLRGLLREARRPHYYCDDPWYSCPKAEGGCCDESAGTECRCGADEWNARIDAALGATASHPAEVPHD